MQANKHEEQTAQKISRAIQLINDPDLQMQFKPNKKLIILQKIAEEKIRRNVIILKIICNQ
ncbi:unnamed protein product [Paramecium pentaurelia]|uniref:Uncharacterized protein n=1 Tax=Paramecium pentaurelia TaxID=43138 RepID=A0A8S1UN49_9CILI|nr:unnamed protein product [Paramecium pentaurelia]